MLHKLLEQFPVLSIIVQCAILLFSAAAIFFVKKNSKKWRRLGFAIGTSGQIFWFISVDPFRDFGIFLLAVWFFLMYAGGLIEEYFPPPKYLARQFFTGDSYHTSYDAVVISYSRKKIEDAVFKSGYPVVNLVLKRIEEADVGALLPTLDVKSYFSELKALKLSMEKYKASLQLQTFNPGLWRHHLLENSRQNDLSLYRRAIVSQINSRSGI